MKVLKLFAGGAEAASRVTEVLGTLARYLTKKVEYLDKMSCILKDLCIKVNKKEKVN